MLAAEAWYAGKALAVPAITIVAIFGVGAYRRAHHVPQSDALFLSLAVVFGLGALCLLIWWTAGAAAIASEARVGPIVFPAALLCLCAWYLTVLALDTGGWAFDTTSLQRAAWMALGAFTAWKSALEIRRVTVS